jgi:hypothetical protein
MKGKQGAEGNPEKRTLTWLWVQQEQWVLNDRNMVY